jgi:regulator of cell morphogenesis and NO signaling
MTATLDMTIRDIVANDFRTAAVFQRHGIDFCCKGNRSIQDACRTIDASAEEVLRGIAAGRRRDGADPVADVGLRHP